MRSLSQIEAMEDKAMTNQPFHTPVMNKEVLEYLNLRPGQCVVDCTLGLAGHALGITEKIGPEGCLVGIDRDNDSLNLAKERLKEFHGICHLVYDDFRHFNEILKRLKIAEVDGILMDLGISSFQMDNPERGFGIKSDGPLDMRMDQNSYISAYDLVNSLSEYEISSILRNFGEERWHKRIARRLVQEREKKPFESTQELSQAVLRAIPYRSKEKIHPATRTFQAFRIAVNRELEALDAALTNCVSYLRKGGRICVIAFHSLEDRIVKNKFRDFAKSGQLNLIFKKPMRPSQEEVINNLRSRSARLRVAERT